MYTSKETALRKSRDVKRKQRHGKNWRQIIIDCGGMCCWEYEGYPCCETENLEFHELFGEGWDGRMQQRILYCPTHHSESHQKYYNLDAYDNRKKSNLMWDVSLEVLELGGHDRWVKKFNLDDSRWGIMLYRTEAQGKLV